MAERRSLTSAVNSGTVPGVDPEVVRSFVTQNQRTERPVVAAVNTAPVQPRETKEVSEQKVSKPKRKANRFQPVGLIPVTVRLRPEIAGALKRASLERELEGEDVFTQQDLVENALEPWLQSEGYL